MTDEASPRVRAALPRGLVDRAPADIAAAEAMMAKIRAVYELYGFEAVETPFIEYTEALGKFLPDQDRPNEGVFSFKDDDEQWLSLRYDLTAPLARYVAEHYERLPKPYRSYRAGWVFRNEKPGPGRYRQFMQFDADTVGAASPAADAEICMMAADCLEALGIKRGDYVIKVNNRKVLDGVMEAIGLGGAENAARRLTVLRAIDKLDRLGPEGVRGAARRRAQGRKRRFHQGRGPRTRGGDRARARLSRTAARLEDNADARWSRSRLRSPSSADRRSWRRGAARDRRAGARRRLWRGPRPSRPLRRPRPRILHRPGVRGRADLRDARRGRQADPLRLGRRRRALRRAGGALSRRAGSGDRLLDRHLAPARGAAGDRQSDRRRRREARAGRRRSCSIATTWPTTSASSRACARRGSPPKCISAPSGLNAQLKYADRRGSLCAVIQGSNERDAPGGREVVIRDLRLGAELAKASKDRADYLELRQKAQFAVAEAAMVARVREIVARR